jgi:hypothetical protein
MLDRQQATDVAQDNSGESAAHEMLLARGT